MASYGAGRKAVVLRALKGMSQKSRYGRRVPSRRPRGKGPIARINPPKRGRPVWEGVPKGKDRAVPTRLPRRPLPFTKSPDYNFGPVE